MKPKITLMSFGFKYGAPRANYYFDVGFIRNPAREKQWGFFANPSEEMQEYILGQASTKEFISYVLPMIVFLSGIDQRQVFAFGCSAGRHRSTTLVEYLAKVLTAKGIDVNVQHRDQNME